MAYPDNHPAVRDHVVTVTGPTGSAQYMPRDQWEKVVAERDEYRRILALISAWRLTSGTRDGDLDALLRRVGEDYDSARAMGDLVTQLRSTPSPGHETATPSEQSGPRCFRCGLAVEDDLGGVVDTTCERHGTCCDGCHDSDQPGREHGYGDESDCICGRNFATVRGLREHLTKARIASGARIGRSG